MATTPVGDFDDDGWASRASGTSGAPPVGAPADQVRAWPAPETVPAPTWPGGPVHPQPVGYAMVGYQPIHPLQHRLANVGQLFVAGLIDVVLVTVTLFVGWALWGAFSATAGKTPGKQIMGLQVVDKHSGAPLGWGAMVILRGIVGGLAFWLIGAVTFSIGSLILWFMPLWDDMNQSLHGKVSNSVVLRVR